MTRPRKVTDDALTVLAEDAIHDGKGGFLKVGDIFHAVDSVAREALIARGFAK